MGVVGRGTVLAGRYQLRDERRADFAEATDWSAVDQILARPVGVRVFPGTGSATALDAARRAALVSDPRLVRVLDVGTYEDVAYVVTEQVGGPTLAQLVAREPLSADQARAVVGEAAAALETARRRGVHHLALRPSAVAVGDDGRVLVSGLALDAVLRGTAGGDARTTSRTDAADLVRLVYTALTGHWPGPVASSDGLPTAPEAGGAPVPPADLVPDVPPDLNTLCAVTLGRDDDGPHSPAEVVRELEPWGEIHTRTTTPPPAAAATPAPVTPASAPSRVVRQSVRSAFSTPTPTAGRPGTPPPAAPQSAPAPVVGTAGPGGSGSAAAPAAAVTAPATPPATRVVPPPAAPAPSPATPPATRTVPPPAPPVSSIAAGVTRASAPQPVPPPGPLGAGPDGPDGAVGTARPQPQRRPPAFPAAAVPTAHAEEDPFDFGLAEEEPPRRVGVAVAIAVVGLAVVVGLGFAVKAFLSGLGGDAEPGAAGTTTTAEQTTSPVTTESSPTPTATPTETETAATGASPVITGITSIDPSDTDGEHQEAVGRAIDGDPSTYWFSQTYNTPDFSGIKPGVGLALTLAEPAVVSTVTLHVNGTGGNVEVRATDAANPTGGDVLASGPLGPDTVLTLSTPATTQSLVLWFTQLPVNGEGKNRIELTEIVLG